MLKMVEIFLVSKFGLQPIDYSKGPINLALTDLQELFKQHLIKREEQLLYWKIYSTYFGEVATL